MHGAVMAALLLPGLYLAWSMITHILQMLAGIVETQFAEYLSGLTDVPATLETQERDSAGKVTLPSESAALRLLCRIHC